MNADGKTFSAELIARTRAALDASTDDFDVATVQRLQAARYAALAAVSAPLARAPSRWAPAFAFAATIAVTIGAWQTLVLPPLPAPRDAVAVLAAQDADLLEDLDFVAWLEVDEHVDAAG